MNILAIGAHFDDVELGCGGTLIKHKANGDNLHIIVVTHSAYLSKSKGISRDRHAARAEGEKSADCLGANLICLDKEPITLVANERLVLDIEEIVDQIHPDRVYTHQVNDSHGDHAAVGYVSIRACRKCDEILLYRSNWYVADDTKEGNFYVDITPHINQKMDLIRLFESEMKTVNYTWIDFVKKQNSASGAKINVDYAETYHIIKRCWR
jgi:LmbE family N-acetylglucosaminyl deacetylase